jgi:predicted transcriptional regulator of viral defense system
MKYDYLKRYTEDLLSKGELIFSKPEVLSTFKISDTAFRSNIKRMVADKKIIFLKNGYYLIIPIEFRQLSIVPPELFIDDLMMSLNIKYYVCLLSAASFYEATHQASQVFQVMVNRPIKPINLGKIQIVFYVNKNLKNISTKSIKTDRGTLEVSSPESTLLDLLKYFHQSGNLNHIATIMIEMIEALNYKNVADILEYYPLLSVQRLGYLSEKFGYLKLENVIYKYLQIQKPKLYSLLMPGEYNKNDYRNKKWHLIINIEIESDL